MTTIAYKEGIIATDGQITAGDAIITSDAEKRFISDGGTVFFLCGSDTDIDDLIKAFPDGKLSRNNYAAGFAVSDGRLFAVVQNNGECKAWEHRMLASWAFGSGFEFALGAMDAGMDAIEAISIAAGRDVATGGTIRAYSATTGEEL